MPKIRVLVCDDEEGVRESLRLILAGGDRSLAFAVNGEEAVAYVKRNAPDLVILDVKMPKMNGLETLSQIKRLRPKVRVLMITGYESNDVAAQAIHLGADDYLTKPFDRETILAKVQRFQGSGKRE